MFMNYRLAMYLMHVEGALRENRVPAQYLTDTCPECGGTIRTWNDATRDLHIVSNTANDGDPKVYAVIVGCEGYWVINPESIGLPRDNWQDWTVDDTAALGVEMTGVRSSDDYPACANPACDHRLCFMERRDLDECPACSHAIPVALRLNDTMDGPRD